MSKSTLNILAELIAKLVVKLNFVLSESEKFSRFMYALGWDINVIPTQFNSIVASLGNISSIYEDIQNENGNVIELNIELLSELKTLFQEIKSLENVDFSSYQSLNEDGFAQKFPKELIDYLFYNFILSSYPKLFIIFESIGLIGTEYIEQEGNRPSHSSKRIYWDKFTSILNNPKDLLVSKYGWDSSDFDQVQFIQNLQSVFNVFNLSTQLYSLNYQQIQLFCPDHEDDKSFYLLKIPLFYKKDNNVISTAGIDIFPFVNSNEQSKGFSIAPFFSTGTGNVFQLNENVQLGYNGGVDLTNGLAIDITPSKVSTRLGMFNENFTESINVAFESWINVSSDDQIQQTIIEDSNENGISFENIKGTFGAKLLKNELNSFVEISLSKAELFIDFSNSDGFIQNAFPLQINIPFEFCIGFSTTNGIYFKGSASTEISLPIHYKTQLFEIKDIKIALSTINSSVGLNVSSNIIINIGPLFIEIHKLGFNYNVDFNSSDSSFGPFNLRGLL